MADISAAGMTGLAGVSARPDMPPHAPFVPGADAQNGEAAMPFVQFRPADSARGRDLPAAAIALPVPWVPPGDDPLSLHEDVDAGRGRPADPVVDAANGYRFASLVTMAEPDGATDTRA